MAIDRVKKVAVTCDLCGGDPTCVKFCPTGALLYLSSEEVSIKLMTTRVNRFLETQLPHPEDKASTVKI
jgi:Fe-S-cluster-containing hydrogenase component 2